MTTHYQQLVEDALVKEKSLSEARRRAHAALGTDREIIDRFTV